MPARSAATGVLPAVCCCCRKAIEICQQKTRTGEKKDTNNSWKIIHKCYAAIYENCHLIGNSFNMQAQNRHLLENIRIVLVNTSHPGNIGATARVMKNMGLKHLYLVAPEQFPDAKATAMAAGADDILQHAIVVPTLAQALKGCIRALATTARSRKIQQQFLLPAQAAAQAHALQNADNKPIAFVFGRERNGLTNQEIEQCEKLIHIPTDPEFSSLNVASAVQIICYELRLVYENLGRVTAPPTRNATLASHDQLEYFFEHLQDNLQRSGFLDIKQSPQIMPKLRELYHRCELSQSELNILRGILTATDKFFPPG